MTTHACVYLAVLRARFAAGASGEASFALWAAARCGTARAGGFGGALAAPRFPLAAFPPCSDPAGVDPTLSVPRSRPPAPRRALLRPAAAAGAFGGGGLSALLPAFAPPPLAPPLPRFGFLGGGSTSALGSTSKPGGTSSGSSRPSGGSGPFRGCTAGAAAGSAGTPTR
jgi:hypothetical protein